MKSILALIVTIGGLCWVPNDAFAQQFLAVSDVLGKGGAKLTKAEVQSLFSGATVSGVQVGNPDTTFKNTFTADGKVSGEAFHKGVPFTKMSGTWSVNDLGQFCQNLNNSQGDKVTGCFTYYSVSGRYFTSRKEEASAPVYERQVSHP